jgi:hypothetical protein
MGLKQRNSWNGYEAVLSRFPFELLRTLNHDACDATWKDLKKGRESLDEFAEVQGNAIAVHDPHSEVCQQNGDGSPEIIRLRHVSKVRHEKRNEKLTVIYSPLICQKRQKQKTIARRMWPILNNS